MQKMKYPARWSVFNIHLNVTDLREEEIEDIREAIEDNVGIEVLEINEIY